MSPRAVISKSGEHAIRVNFGQNLFEWYVGFDEKGLFHTIKPQQTGYVPDAYEKKIIAMFIHSIGSDSRSLEEIYDDLEVEIQVNEPDPLDSYSFLFHKPTGDLWLHVGDESPEIVKYVTGGLLYVYTFKEYPKLPKKLKEVAPRNLPSRRERCATLTMPTHGDGEIQMDMRSDLIFYHYYSADRGIETLEEEMQRIMDIEGSVSIGSIQYGKYYQAERATYPDNFAIFSLSTGTMNYIVGRYWRQVYGEERKAMGDYASFLPRQDKGDLELFAFPEEEEESDDFFDFIIQQAIMYIGNLLTDGSLNEAKPKRIVI